MNRSRQEVYIIAEAGVNHNGHYELARELVEAAAFCGANAIKFQTFKADKLASSEVGKASYQIVHTKEGTQKEMLKNLELKQEWHKPLQDYAQSLGIEFISTAFDHDSLLFLQGLNLPRYKIPSGELTNAPLLWHFAKSNAPLILSTGMATLAEIEQALAIINHGLNYTHEPVSIDEVWHAWHDHAVINSLQGKVTILHCTSQYPTPWQEVNLRAMQTLAQAFKLDVGYSDHTEGTVIPIAAVAMGACIIEKHITLDRSMPGPDHHASLEIDEFKKMVEDIRSLEHALGSGVKAPQREEWDTRRLVRQSLVAARPLKNGQVFRKEDLTTARTGLGISAALYWNLIGTSAKKGYAVGEVIE